MTNEQIKLLESDMEYLIAKYPEEFIEEGLKLLKQQLVIGRYRLDLLFEDRKKAKLIVELQRGTLDRLHLYKILDYYDEYKDCNPADFIELMVIANDISSVRKRRLKDRGIEYREITEDEFISFVKKHDEWRNLPSNCKDKQVVEEKIVTDDFLAYSIEKYPIATFNKEYTLKNSQLHKIDNKRMQEVCVSASIVSIMGSLHGVDRNTLEKVKQDLSKNENMTEFYKSFALAHLEYNINNMHLFETTDMKKLAQKSTYSKEAEMTLPLRDKLLKMIAEVLKKVYFDFSEFQKITVEFNQIKNNLTEYSAYYNYILLLVWKDLYHSICLSLYGTGVYLLGYDFPSNKLISRKIPEHYKFDNTFFYEAAAHLVSINWFRGIYLDSIVEENDYWVCDSYIPQIPYIENSIELTRDMINFAFSNKEFTISKASEVVVNSGDVKSITFMDAGQGIVLYKTKYISDAITVTILIYDPDKKQHCETCDYYLSPCDGTPCEIKSNEIDTFETLFYVMNVVNSNNVNDFEQKNNNETALAACIIRDLYICENKDVYYNRVERANITNKKVKKSSPNKIVYLPRFRINNLGDPDDLRFREKIIEIIPHRVEGHLRRCENPNPKQLDLAGEYGVFVPDGYTFVRPYEKGAYEVKKIYKSKSALKAIYGWED